MHGAAKVVVSGTACLLSVCRASTHTIVMHMSPLRSARIENQSRQNRVAMKQSRAYISSYQAGEDRGNLTVREPPPSPQNEKTQTKTQTTDNLNRQNSKALQICREKETQTMVRVSSPAKLRPWSELTAKMVMGVVPGLVRNFSLEPGLPKEPSELKTRSPRTEDLELFRARMGTEQGYLTMCCLCDMQTHTTPDSSIYLL